MSTRSDLDPQRIRELAYSIWEAGGCRQDTAQEDWLTAERQLLGESPPTKAATPRAVDDSIKQSFPASDPPASRLPDEPPVNAEAKWEAAAKAKARENNPRERSGSPVAPAQGRSTRTSSSQGPDSKRPPH